MRGLVLDDIGRIALRDDLADPTIEEPTDAIVRVRVAGLCGSDLHPYRGKEAARTGVVQGHEAVGEIVALGEAVTDLQLGDRVLSSFTTSCLDCPTCQRGITARCERSRLLGWGDPSPAGPALHGAQAELVRIPDAAGTLLAVPDAIDDLAAILLTDNLPTGWEAVRRTGAMADEPLVVVGLGAVGLCAVHAAITLGAGPVIGVDPVAARRERAVALGAEEAVAPDDARAALATHTGQRQVLAVVEAAGSHSGQRLGFELTAPGGTLSIIAVQTAERFSFDPVEAYGRTLRIATGRASVRATLTDLLPAVVRGEVTIPSEHIVTHPDLTLDDGPEVYERFAGHERGMVKAVFRP
ncbi:MAG: alcohol dehydrogenase catalytic domain-containing protein [Nitriliruptoraceae bacterium]|nr:alcohol dehydrogenase catalytic domain-containing protein [Nitriliruptoraceae bacterium]